MLSSVVGSTITKHTGDPQAAFRKFENSFSGGYDWYSPQGSKEHGIALANLATMAFTPYVPTIARPELVHWRYLFDVSEAVTAFREKREPRFR